MFHLHSRRARPLRIASFASATFLALSAAAWAQDLVRVNGQSITLAQVEAANAAAASNPAVRQQVIEQLAQQNLLAGTVKSPAPGLTERIEAAQANVKRQMLAQWAADQFLQQHPVTEADIDAEYAKLTKAQAKQQYWVRWLVVSTPESAQSTLRELKSAQKGFAELAIERSIGQNAELGGALGWQTEQTLPAAVLAVVRKLKTGEVAGPIALDSGYAIVQLVAQRAAPKPTLDQLKPQIEQNLRSALLQDYIKELAKTAKIDNLMSSPEVTPAPAAKETGHEAQ